MKEISGESKNPLFFDPSIRLKSSLRMKHYGVSLEASFIFY